MTMPRGQTTIRGELTGGRDFYSVISGFRPLLASLVTEQLDTSTINANYLSAYWPISEVALFVIQIIDIRDKYTSRYRVSLEIVFQVSLSLFRACAAPSMHYCLLEIPWCKARFCFLAKFFFQVTLTWVKCCIAMHCGGRWNNFNWQGCIKLQLTTDCHSAEQMIWAIGLWNLYCRTWGCILQPSASWSPRGV